MATLQKIRNQGTLLVVIIFVALAAFLLGDAFRSGAFGKDSQVVGNINGTEINIIDFQKDVQNMTEIYKASSGNSQLDDQAMAQVRDEVWKKYENTYILMPACEEIGVAVTADELFDMVQGNHINPSIQSMFTDPQTGQFQRAAVLNFLRAVSSGQVTAQQYAYWRYLEEQIKIERLNNKYNALIGKGIYFTSLDAKNNFNQKNTAVNFNYLKIPYTTIADSTISVSDSELQEYYDAHKEEFKQEPTRAIEYVQLPVLPTAEDDKETLSWIQDIRDEFATTSDNQQFVESNSDVPFDGQYNKREELAESLGEFAFTANVGSVFGPEKVGSSYYLYKLDSRKMLPDSVEARHILINPQTVGGIDAANALADSLKTVIETRKATFAEVATEYSADKGSAVKGGDLGWFKRNQMIKPFEEAAFKGTINGLYIVTSQFGVHIIQPTDRGRLVNQVRLAKLVKNIEPSIKTEDAVYAKASLLATKASAEEYSAEVKEMGLNVRKIELEKNQQLIPGLEDSRSLIREAFLTEDLNSLITSNEGSSIYKFGDNFVLARLVEINDDEYATLDSKKATITRQVVLEKKGEKIAEEMKAAGSNISAISTAMNVKANNAEGVNFDMYMVPTIGIEPAVQGTAWSLDQGVLSEPIPGNSGVFITKNSSVTKAPEPRDNDLATEQVRLSTSTAYRVNSQTFNALRESVEYEDNRTNFY